MPEQILLVQPMEEIRLNQMSTLQSMEDHMLDQLGIPEGLWRAHTGAEKRCEKKMRRREKLLCTDHTHFPPTSCTIWEGGRGVWYEEATLSLEKHGGKMLT